MDGWMDGRLVDKFPHKRIHQTDWGGMFNDHRVTNCRAFHLMASDNYFGPRAEGATVSGLTIAMVQQ